MGVCFKRSTFRKQLENVIDSHHTSIAASDVDDQGLRPISIFSCNIKTYKSQLQLFDAFISMQ
jgi:hypothetical protein